jgi:hypothetical protein
LDTSLRRILLTNFIKEPDYLIHIFLAFARSTETDLGLDPTIKGIQSKSDCFEGSPSGDANTYAVSRTGLNTNQVVEQSEEGTESGEIAAPFKGRVYHITVRGEEGDEQTFETLRLLSGRSATITYTHGTRVWEVFDIFDPLRKRRVLKDSWIADNNPPEAEILKEICVRLRSEPEKLEHFPVIYAHGAVYFDGKGIDDTSELIRRGVEWSIKGDLPLCTGPCKLFFHSSFFY